MARAAQPFDAASRAARSGGYARSAQREILGRSVCHLTRRRPLPRRTGAATHRRPTGHVRVAGIGWHRLERHRLPACRGASRLEAAARLHRGLAREPGADAAHDPARAQASGRTRRAIRQPTSTGRARRATAACRSRSSTSSRPPTYGSSSTCSAPPTPVAGDESTLEYGVRLAASVAARGLLENRNVALSASGAHIGPLPADRGPRQYQKIMQTLRRGPGRRQSTVQPPARRGRGATAAGDDRADHHAFARARLGATHERAARPWRGGRGDAARRAGVREPGATRHRAHRAIRGGHRDRAARGATIRHALAEHDLRWHTILPMEPLSGQLISRRDRRLAAPHERRFDEPRPAPAVDR